MEAAGIDASGEAGSDSLYGIPDVQIHGRSGRMQGCQKRVIPAVEHYEASLLTALLSVGLHIG